MSAAVRSAAVHDHAKVLDEGVGSREPRARAESRLLLGPINELKLLVATMPYMSVFLGLIDAVGGIHRGLAPTIRTQLQEAAGAVGAEAFSPFSGHDRNFIVPDFAVPVPPVGAVGMSTVIEALRDTSLDTVAEQVSAGFGHDVPQPWRIAVDRPDRWHPRFITATISATSALRDLWTRGQPAIDRELRRVQLAQETDQLEALLSGLTPKIRYRHETLVFEEDWGIGDIKLAGRPLVLVPVIAGPAMIFSNLADGEDTVWIGYPVAELDLSTASGLAEPTPLQSLLGVQRSLVLRYLNRPSSMAEIANLLRTTPANATFHCQQLAAAALVARRRTGRQVRVERTQLGSELLGLLDRAAVRPVRSA